MREAGEVAYQFPLMSNGERIPASKSSSTPLEHSEYPLGGARGLTDCDSIRESSHCACARAAGVQRDVPVL